MLNKKVNKSYHINQGKGNSHLALNTAFIRNYQPLIFKLLWQEKEICPWSIEQSLRNFSHTPFVDTMMLSFFSFSETDNLLPRHVFKHQ